MFLSPSSSPRHVFESRTNVPLNQRQSSLKFLVTPPNELKPKRQALLTGAGPNKRIRLSQQTPDETDTSDSSSGEEDSDNEPDVFLAGPSTRSVQAARRVNQAYIQPSIFFGFKSQLSTHPILQSFVSSNKADIFQCVSAQPDRHLAPPYACSYSHAAKEGKQPHLAVANEEGTVHIFDTTKRRDWDPEPQRTTLRPHQNGVFEVKWDESDARIATCSADQSTRITDSQTSTITHILRGHSSTIKCLTWDANHQDLLATGSRDGTICLWDLRVGEKYRDGNVYIVQPCHIIAGAHQEPSPKGRLRRVRKKHVSAAPGITSLLYPAALASGLVSSSSADGILNYWDLRCLTNTKKESKTPLFLSSSVDPTTLKGSRRPRGILSLTAGCGPTAGLIYGLGADSHIHCYSIPSLNPEPSRRYFHENLKASSFYVSLSVSTCGRWLASGGTSTDGRAFLFDIATAPSPNKSPAGVQLHGQTGEVGAVDWAHDSLATCADDGTVRIWRPDQAVYRGCLEQPQEKRWDWSWASLKDTVYSECDV